MPVSTSSLVSTMSVKPLMRVAWRIIRASYQPQRRGRPAFTPTSPPVVCRYSPHLSNNSVGNGPAPTRVEPIGRDRAGVHGGRVRLDDAEHAVDAGGAHAGARAGTAGGGVRAGHEGVGAVVDDQEGGLAALNQHHFVAVEGRVQHLGG